MTQRLVISIGLVALLACACSQNEPYVQPEAQEPLVEAPAQTTGPADGEVAAAAAEQTPPPAVDLAAVDPATFDEQAPAKFVVKFETTEGDFEVELVREWAPRGVDRFYNLVKAGYYTDIAAFRVIDGFMAQFGIHGDPAVNEVWKEAKIKDDEQVTGVSNTRGMLTYAMAGPHTRTVQLYINYRNNAQLDAMGFHPIGRVLGDGMTVVDAWYKGYGEGAPRGKGPDQMRIQTHGNEYLREGYPELSYIKSITLVSTE